MSKTITMSDNAYDKLKDQILKEEGNVIEIKNRFTGSVIYQSTKETMKEAVIEAIGSGSDLSYSDLSGSNLSNSNFSNSDFSGSDFRGSNLSNSDLSNSNLSGSNFSGSNLSGVDFYHTNFYGKGGTTKIKKEQINDFLVALGVIVN